jgi:hypothetical protein
MAEPTEDWYEQVPPGNMQLLQGDLIFGCSVVVPLVNPNEEEITAEIRDYNVVLLSQSCDLENNKLSYSVVCPFAELKEFVQQKPNLFNYGLTKQLLQRDAQPGYHVLNPIAISDRGHDFLVVDFHETFSVPIRQLKEQVGAMKTSRIRLRSPYRERLAQAFAQFYMRIALPIPLGKITS